MRHTNEEEPWWQVWLTRILVTASIVVVFEYLGKQPLPERRQESGNNEEDIATNYSALQYGDILAQDEDSKEEIPISHDSNIGESRKISAETSTATNGNYEDANGSKEAGQEVTNDKNKATKQDQTENENKSESDNDEDVNDTSCESSESNNTPATATATASGTAESETGNFKTKSSAHPGMCGFHRWYDIETSLYRQYQVGRTDGVDVIPNYVPHSRRGTVKIHLKVKNEMTFSPQAIDVYWINYKGGEDHKGRISRGETWHQTTWIEHPWVFRLSDTNELLLHYIPDRVIQHLDEAPTCDENDPSIGVQTFTIRSPTAEAVRDHHICSIIDPILPHPASHHFHNPDEAHSWTLLHMKRQDYFTYHPGAQLLTKYLTNIAMHPDKANYRKIRIANKNFFHSIWQTAARGLLLAAGFVEQNAYAEFGTTNPLPSTRVQDISLVLFRLEQVKTQLEQEARRNASALHRQPEGVDGYGRAGFGRAGAMH